MLNPDYRRGLRLALCAHLGLIAALLAGVFVRGCACLRTESLLAQPIEFLVEAPPDSVHPQEDELPTEEFPDSVSDPEPEPSPEDIPDPEPVERKPRREPIRVSGKRVVRGEPPPPARKPAIDPEELRRRLLEGARIADRTTDPDEDDRGLARVRDVLYAAWVQPPNSGMRPARVELVFGDHGRVLEHSLKESSGDEAYDASVMRAVGSVKRITGLTEGFLRRYSRLTVEFKLR